MRAIRKLFVRTILLLSATGGLAGEVGSAAEPAPACGPTCCKTCRLVREMKKVEVTCWNCKCEDFCVPGPSKPGCVHDEPLCAPGGGGDEQCQSAHAPEFHWRDWTPGGAKVYSRKKLVKTTVTKLVPSYKWVVEESCDQEKCDTSPALAQRDQSQ